MLASNCVELRSKIHEMNFFFFSELSIPVSVKELDDITFQHAQEQTSQLSLTAIKS
jgi:hypothetical protein